MANYKVTVSQDGLLDIVTEHDTYDDAAREFHERIGLHIVHDGDAPPTTFTISSAMRNPLTGEKFWSIIDTYEFGGFAKTPEKKDPNRPFHCPMCKAALNLYEDVEQWSAATIAYTFAGVDEWGAAEWERSREDIDESCMAHRVYCKQCGDFMPLDEWEEAFEGR